MSEPYYRCGYASSLLMPGVILGVGITADPIGLAPGAGPPSDNAMALRLPDPAQVNDDASAPPWWASEGCTPTTSAETTSRSLAAVAALQAPGDARR